MKDAVYTSIGPLFRGTAAHTAWQETRRPLRYARLLRAASPRAIVADGEWEWEPYEAVSASIVAVGEAAKRQRVPVPRRLISTGGADLRAAAARIRLPRAGNAPDVSIIVPVYGQLRYTIECLLSIAAAGSATQRFEVIVADDASPDDTYSVLHGVPNLRIVRQPANQGFVRNCNSAARETRGRLIVFLNNDTQVQPGWLDAMARVFTDEKDVGAVGPRILYPSGHLQEAGSRVRRDGSVEMIGHGELPEDPRWGYRRDVDYISGACLMIEWDLFSDLGGFADALAPAYCEDLDLGLRLHDRSRRSICTPDAEVVHHLSVTTAATDGLFKDQAIVRNMQVIAEQRQEQLDRLDDVRFVSFYLPQFHPIEQNDLWWGPGFTEWTNVAKAQPSWLGHYQPRLPADLGFYDLRVPETLQAQWRLASRYGIDAFCYYYYWFGGQRLLDRPLQALLDKQSRVHPFCICWANENWTRRWDGQEKDVLIAQEHSPRDDIEVIRDIARYMQHPAYLRVRGRPLLLVYRVDLFPDFRETAERWRSECLRMGIGEIELVMVESFLFAGLGGNPSRFGCDAVVEYPAHHIPDTTEPGGPLLNSAFSGGVANYAETAVRKATRAHPGFKLYRSVMPGFDNTARRRNNPFVLENATPGAFQAWLEAAIAATKRDLQGDDRLVFINAWNEWGESAYVEPDQRFGHTYLEAIRNARETSSVPGAALV